MKTKITKLALVFLIAITCTSCVVDAFNGIKGDRKVVSENRKITTKKTTKNNKNKSINQSITPSN